MPLPPELFRQHPLQPLHADGLRGKLRVGVVLLRRRRMQVVLRELRQLVFSARCVEQIGRQRRVEHKAVGIDARCKQPAHQRLDVMRRFRHGAVKQPLENIGVIQAKAFALQKRDRSVPADGDRVQLRRGGDRHGRSVQQGERPSAVSAVTTSHFASAASAASVSGTSNAALRRPYWSISF